MNYGFSPSGHTSRDSANFRSLAINENHHQPRDHAVRCSVCAAKTWHLGGRCDAHYVRPEPVIAKERKWDGKVLQDNALDAQDRQDW